MTRSGYIFRVHVPLPMFFIFYHSLCSRTVGLREWDDSHLLYFLKFCSVLHSSWCFSFFVCSPPHKGYPVWHLLEHLLRPKLVPGLSALSDWAFICPHFPPSSDRTDQTKGRVTRPIYRFNIIRKTYVLFIFLNDVWTLNDVWKGS